MTEKEIVNTVELEHDESPILFTTAALSVISSAISDEALEGQGLRVGLRGGGCAGYQYVLDFDGPRSYDYIMKYDNIIVYIDQVSATHLEGTTIDYVTSLMESGFKFINPNAEKTCGCRSSFG